MASVNDKRDKESSNSMWGGRFAEGPSAIMREINASIPFDKALWREDIAGSRAHVAMLAKQGIVSEADAKAIDEGLQQIAGEYERDGVPEDWDLEDIHMTVEARLTEIVGPAAGRLHTARSRNDQVATDLRLYCRRAIDRIDAGLLELQRAFLGMAEREHDLVIPAYTHLRRAQPVLAAHQLLTWCEKFARDRDRLADCRRRTNVMPLGSAALAGTSLPIDREKTRAALGFAATAANSLDAASDRDFVCELAFVLSLTAVHLSQWAEEWIIYSTDEFGFLRLPEAFCTGSSIMPQKINPDVLELVRGKSARTIGNVQQLLVLLKGLPTAYNRDLQEDKEAVFDSLDTLEAMLGVAAPLVAGTSFDRDRITASIDRGHLDATTLMEALIGEGVPQRTAHETVGKLVRRALTAGCSLADLSDDACRADYAGWNASLRHALGASRAVERMASFGSTAPAQVADQIASWRHRLETAVD